MRNTQVIRKYLFLFLSVCIKMNNKICKSLVISSIDFIPRRVYNIITERGDTPRDERKKKNESFNKGCNH